MGWSQTSAFLWCGLLSLTVPSLPASARPIEFSTGSSNTAVVTPIAEVLPEVAGSDVWQTLSNWIDSLCFLVGCDMLRPANEIATRESCELAIYTFITKFEAQIPKSGYSMDQKLIANIAINQILETLKVHPQSLDKELETRFRVVIEVLRIELSF